MVRFAHRPRKFSRPHCHRTAMLALATASPCSTSFRPFGCLPLRVAVRWRYRDGEHQGRAPRGFEAACGPHRTGNRIFVCEIGRFLPQGRPHRGPARFFDGNTADERHPSAAFYRPLWRVLGLAPETLPFRRGTGGRAARAAKPGSAAARSHAQPSGEHGEDRENPPLAAALGAEPPAFIQAQSPKIAPRSRPIFRAGRKSLAGTASGCR